VVVTVKGAEISNLFRSAGFIIAPGDMPVYFAWYRYLNPIYWSLYGIIVSQLGGTPPPPLVHLSSYLLPPFPETIFVHIIAAIQAVHARPSMLCCIASHKFWRSDIQ